MFYTGPKKSPERHQKQEAARHVFSDESFDVPEDSITRESSASSSSSFGSVNTPPHGSLGSPDGVRQNSGTVSSQKGRFR